MLNRLKPKSEFSRNVLTLMTGTTIAQAIPIAISPILTRLYTPEDFGVFALYMSIVSILSVIVTGKYELAIMLPKKDKDALNILFLSISITFIISFFVFLIILFFNKEIVFILSDENISNWLYLIPFSILIVGLFNSFNLWFNRNKNYKLLARAKVTQSFTNSGSSIIFGILKFNQIGLIISSFFSQLVAILLLLKEFDFEHFKNINKKRLIILASRYSKFPKITMLHHLTNNVSSNLPIIMITKYFSSNDAGYFMFSNKIVGLPISLIGSSISDVFFRELSYKKEHDKNNLLRFFEKIVLKLLIIFFPLFLLLFFILPKITAIFFGENWQMLGIYLQILLPMFFFRSIGSVLSHTVVVFEKQFEGFILEIVNIFLRICSICIGIISDNIFVGLVLYSTSSSLLTIYRIFWYKKIIKEYI